MNNLNSYKNRLSSSHSKSGRGMRMVLALSLAFVGLQETGHATGGYTTGFESGFNCGPGAELAGQESWSIDDPTENLSFFVRLNGSTAAGLGGYYDTPATGSVGLSHPVGIPLSGASFHATTAVIKSTRLFPGRDSMEWCFLNPQSAKLLTFCFQPAEDDPDLLRITWSTGSGAPVQTGLAVYYGAPYDIEVKFESTDGIDAAFVATIKGTKSVQFKGSLAGLASETWGSIEAHFVVKGTEAGDNFMVFDNITAMPPPFVDADGDGYSADLEAWFGTSDTSTTSTPAPVLTGSSTLPSLTFPSIPGKTYLIDSSVDLDSWVTTPVTAITEQTIWTESAAADTRRRFYRIRKP